VLLIIWPAPSQEVKQVDHVFILLGFIRGFGGLCGSCPYMRIGLVSGPYNRGPKLLWCRAYERGETLALLAEGVLVEVLMQPYLSLMVGCLLANHVP